VPEKQYLRRGNPNAEWVLLRLPVIVLLICLVPAVEPPSKNPPSAQPDRSGLLRVREDLAAVQVELMQVMRTDPDRTCVLQQREEQLKYQLRTEQIRRAAPALAQQTGFGTPRS
jgi:hypothetical protein